MAQTLARGIRNNNPLNIRRGDNWQGLAERQDAAFCTFVSMQYGIRAACRILLSYHRRGIRTVRDIIQQWAPPIENDTSAYLRTVCKRTGFVPEHVLNIYNANEVVALLLAMSYVECANVLDPQLFYEGYALAHIG